MKNKAFTLDNVRKALVDENKPEVLDVLDKLNSSEWWKQKCALEQKPRVEVASARKRPLASTGFKSPLIKRPAPDNIINSKTPSKLASKPPHVNQNTPARLTPSKLTPNSKLTRANPTSALEFQDPELAELAAIKRTLEKDVENLESKLTKVRLAAKYLENDEESRVKNLIDKWQSATAAALSDLRTLIGPQMHQNSAITTQQSDPYAASNRKGATSQIEKDWQKFFRSLRGGPAAKKAIDNNKDDESGDEMESSDALTFIPPAEPRMFTLKELAKNLGYDLALLGDHVAMDDEDEDVLLVQSALEVLKNQLAKAEEDVEVLLDQKARALHDPTNFINGLMNKNANKSNLPSLQRVIAIPTIDFAKYDGTLRTTLEAGDFVNGPVTRTRVNGIFKSVGYNNVFSGQETMSPTASSNYMSLPPATATVTTPAPAPVPAIGLGTATPTPTAANNSMEVPGELREGPWTDAENRKLLQLIDLYPLEESQAARAMKISRALGSRTPSQVANRLQKLIGIESAKSNTARARVSLQLRLANGSRRTSGVQYLSAPSAPVLMPEDDSDNDGLDPIDPSLKDSEEYQELLRLKRKAKLGGGNRENERNVSSEELVHYGFSCDACQMAPIIGVWIFRLAFAQLELN
ncbi:ZZ-type zinc finger-containing protein 3 [Blyttiomyces sp. JEL0837]|nr:ZZ-type zinc finger-containing protein 3 [Blyttiomyces sp. JEL0837]